MIPFEYMQNTVSARQLQRNYKSVLEEANKIKKPLIVISNNKPQGAIIGLDLLEKMRLNLLYEEAMEEYKEGKLKVIDTEEKLEVFFDEIRKAAE